MGKYTTAANCQKWISTQSIGGSGGSGQLPAIDTTRVESWISQHEAIFDNYARSFCPTLSFTADSLTIIARWVELMTVGDTRMGTFFAAELQRLESLQKGWRKEADRLWMEQIASGIGVVCTAIPEVPRVAPSSAYIRTVTPKSSAKHRYADSTS